MPNEGDFNDIGYFQIPIMGMVNKLEETLSEDSTESESEYGKFIKGFKMSHH